MRDQLKSFIHNKIDTYTKFYNEETINPSLIDDTKHAFNIIKRNYDISHILKRFVEGDFLYDVDKFKLFDYIDDIIRVEMFIFNNLDILDADIDNIAKHMELKQEIVVRYGKPNPRPVR